MSFILRWRYEDGSFPQVVYPSGRVNRYPQWVAAVGDILRAMALLKAYGHEVDPEPTRSWLLQGQEPSGAFRTAWGFASQATQRPPGPLPEFRDLLPVCGWNDKAFRYLTEEYGSGGVWEQESKGVGSHTKNGKRNTEHASRNTQYAIRIMQHEVDCFWRDQRLRYCEDESAIELRRGNDVLYRWQKGSDWAGICAPELWWK